MLYKRILSTPFRDVGNYWDPYMGFASQQTLEILGSEEEVSMLVSAYDTNDHNKMSGFWRQNWGVESDEDRQVELKQMLIDARKAVFDVVLACACDV